MLRPHAVSNSKLAPGRHKKASSTILTRSCSAGRKLWQQHSRNAGHCKNNQQHARLQHPTASLQLLALAYLAAWPCVSNSVTHHTIYKAVAQWCWPALAGQRGADLEQTDLTPAVVTTALRVAAGGLL